MLRNSFCSLALAWCLVSFAPHSVAGPNLSVHQRDERPFAIEQHEQFRRSLLEQKPRILFIGDSLTSRWQSTGKSYWLHHFEPLGAFDVGIEGETSAGLLWRIQDGEFDGISPEKIVLLIGSSSISSNPANIAEGVIAVLRQLERAFPAATILCLGILPRDSLGSPIREKVAEVNQMVARRLAEDPSFGHVHYADLGYVLLADDGSFRPGYMMPDQDHMLAPAYDALGAAILPLLSVRR